MLPQLLDGFDSPAVVLPESLGEPVLAFGEVIPTLNTLGYRILSDGTAIPSQTCFTDQH